MEMEEDTTETVLRKLNLLTENKKELFCCGELKVIEQSLDGTELQYSQKNRNHNETNT